MHNADVPINAAIRNAAELVAKDQNALHPSMLHCAASLIGRAWIDQIVADANEWAASGDERRRRNVAAARKLAGEFADDIVMSSVDQQPMYHVIGFSGRRAISVSMMLSTGVPLWVHYYDFVCRVVESSETSETTVGNSCDMA